MRKSNKNVIYYPQARFTNFSPKKQSRRLHLIWKRVSFSHKDVFYFFCTNRNFLGCKCLLFATFFCDENRNLRRFYYKRARYYMCAVTWQHKTISSTGVYLMAKRLMHSPVSNYFSTFYQNVMNKKIWLCDVGLNINIFLKGNVVSLTSVWTVCYFDGFGK